MKTFMGALTYLFSVNEPLRCVLYSLESIMSQAVLESLNGSNLY